MISTSRILRNPSSPKNWVTYLEKNTKQDGNINHHYRHLCYPWRCLDVVVMKSLQLYVLNGIAMFLGWLILELIENDGSVPIQCSQFISQRFNIKMEKKNIKDLHVLSFGDGTRGIMGCEEEAAKKSRQERTIETVTELVEV
ncbi:hypothetical protein Tco_0154786 [Tanacetum coccineum]